MNRIIFLLLIIINIPLCSCADEDKSLNSKTTKTETEDSKKKEQKVKDPEVKDTYLKLFQTGYITKEDLEKSKLLLKEPPEEIIINEQANTEIPTTFKGAQTPSVHEKNQKKFLKEMRKTENSIRQGLDREAAKKEGNSFIITPSRVPFVEPSNNW